VRRAAQSCALPGVPQRAQGCAVMRASNRGSCGEEEGGASQRTNKETYSMRDAAGEALNTFDALLAKIPPVDTDLFHRAMSRWRAAEHSEAWPAVFEDERGIPHRHCCCSPEVEARPCSSPLSAAWSTPRGLRLPPSSLAWSSGHRGLPIPLRLPASSPLPPSHMTRGSFPR
jgi:hypothetical protein